MTGRVNRPAPDLLRVERAALLLAQGATPEPGPAGMVRLVLRGAGVMLADRAVIEEAQRPGLSLPSGAGKGG